MRTKLFAQGSIKVRYFTILEMIVYIATLSTISLFLFKFFHSSVKLNRQAVTRSHRYQEVAHLHNEWKSFIGETNVKDWTIKNDGFSADDVSLTEETGQVPVYEQKKKTSSGNSSDGAFDFFFGGSEEDGTPTPTPPEPPKIIGYETRKTGALVLSSADNSTKALLLPKYATPVFSIEKDGKTSLAVMTLVFPDSPNFRRETIRLVATKLEEAL